MVYKFFDKKSSGSSIANEPNYQLADELHKPIIRKFEKRKVYSLFRGNIWGVGLADKQSLSKYNKWNKYLLCAIYVFSKYAWVVPLKNKKGVSIINVFQTIISEGRKPNKIWVCQSSEFYNIPLKIFLKQTTSKCVQDTMKENLVVAERFIRTSKNKIFNNMTAVSKMFILMC